jgi:large subunit ribosomal protein L21
MFALFQAGAQHIRAKCADVISVDKISNDVGTSVSFDQVLLIDADGKTQVGAPYVSGCTVRAEVISHGRGPKVIAFKKRRRKNSKRKRGSRKDFTLLRVTEILHAA